MKLRDALAIKQTEADKFRKENNMLLDKIKILKENKIQSDSN